MSNLHPVVSLPLAFGFGNLAMLGWLGAAAAPILIHLWMRHAHRDTRWAAMEFLREAIKRNARRLKLQQWLLLAVRTLLLVLLALAAAKPQLSGWRLLAGGPQVHRVVVLDASMSMRFEDQGETLIGRAKRLAQELLQEASPGDTFSVLLLADPAPTLVAGPMADARRAISLLTNVEPTYGGANLADTLAVASQVIDDAEQQQRHLAAHDVVIFTDLAGETWRQAAGEGPAREAIDRLAGQAKLTVVDVGVPDAANVAVGELQVAGTLATTAEPIQLECQVTAYGGSPANSLVLQLMAGRTSVDEQEVSLSAAGDATATFETRLPRPDWQSLWVRTTGDRLPADDQAYLAVDVRERIRVLLVEGEPSAARYLRHALEPGGGISPIAAQVVPEGAVLDTPLEPFDCVMLCNVARFTRDERTLLERYVRQGGTLVFFLGDRVLSDAYNRVLAGDGGWHAPLGATALGLLQADVDQALLPASVGPLVASSVPGIDPLGYQHPIAAAFRGSERAGLLSTPVNRYFQLQPSDTASVALALPSGDPLLVTQPYGNGMVAMVATAATLDTVDPSTSQPWTMLPAWPSFLPIVRETLAYGLGETRAAHAQLVGEPLTGVLPLAYSADRLAVHRPDGRTDRVPVERTPTGPRWRYDATSLPGVYRMSPEGGSRTLAGVAVNTPAVESDLTRVDVAALPESLDVRRGAAQDNSMADLMGERGLHRGLLYGALALLLIEPVLAWRFAGRAA